MYRITFPEGRAFTGTYLTVPFAQGVGQTNDDYLAERFGKKGLLVEEEKIPTPKKPADQPTEEKRLSPEKPKRATKQTDAP